MKLDLVQFEDRMKKTIAIYEEELAGIRVGRASSKLLDRVTIPYYGDQSPIAQVAQIKATDARTLTITPWDASTLKAIEKAIQASDIGITPQNDGKMIRLVFPQLNEERRKELTKQTAKMNEDTKVALRNIRRDANEKCKDMKKKSEMTEDEQKVSEKEIQDLTDKYIKLSDAVTAKKDKEIMEI